MMDSRGVQHGDLQKRPNARLTGTTFDAKHLDRFLQTEYGEKGIYPVPVTPPEAKGLSLGGSKPIMGESQKMIPAQSNVRPDPCFLTVPRAMRKEVNHSVTNKPLEFAPQVPVRVFGGELPKSKEVYKKELSEVDKLRTTFDPKKMLLNQEDTSLKQPMERRKEVEEIKKNNKAFQEFKLAHGEAGRRDRDVKAGWKNGIVGVDSFMDRNTFFFKDVQEKLVDKELGRIEINERNVEAVKKYKATNQLIEMNNSGYVPPGPDEKMKIAPGWTSKPVGKERFTNTQKDLFEPLETHFSKERALKLHEESTKGRKFDIISGVSNKVVL